MRIVRIHMYMNMCEVHNNTVVYEVEQWYLSHTNKTNTRPNMKFQYGEWPRMSPFGIGLEVWLRY